MERESLTSHPQVLSGARVFTGTRVPLQALFDYIDAGDTLASFLEDFPGVSREQALRVLTSERSPAVKSRRQSTRHRNVDETQMIGDASAAADAWLERIDAGDVEAT